MQLQLSRLASPLGPLLLVTDGAHNIRALGFSDYQASLHQGLARHYGPHTLQEADPPAPISAALSRYFDGDLGAIDPLPVAVAGTHLQRKVWMALRRIPAGSTASYRQLAVASALSDPRAAIAIGGINASNLVAIVIPCHRVIGSGGDLKGYAWGVHRKRWLLDHEKALPLRQPEPARNLSLPGF